MSRWWADPLTLRVGAGGLNGPAPRGLDCVPLIDASSAWQPVLDVFERQLQKASAPARSRVRVVLADDLVCWTMVPWSVELSGAVARQALARQCVAETYGEAVRHWDLSMDTSSFGAHALACAVDPVLVAGIAKALDARGLRLVGLQPLLVSCLNQSRRRLKNADAWFVVRHASGVSMLLLQGGLPVHVRVINSPRDPLGRLLDREHFVQGLEAMPTDVYVVDDEMAPNQAPLAITPSSIWRWHRVDPLEPRDQLRDVRELTA